MGASFPCPAGAHARDAVTGQAWPAFLSGWAGILASKVSEKQMSKEQITVKGYVTAVPRGTDARQARVAIVQDDVEYRIIPRGAGVDLDDEVSVPVEVTGLLEVADEMSYLMVRGYTVLEDDSWLEEK